LLHTYEKEDENRIPFLDVMIIRIANLIETTVYRKPTTNNVYLHWNAFAPKTCKRGTLKTIIKRAYLICSTDKHLEEELKFIGNVFQNINGFPKWVISQIMDEMKEKSNINPNQERYPNDNAETMEYLQLCLPYKGQEGDKLLKSVNKTINETLPDNKKSRLIFTSTKLSSKFNIKDKTDVKHQHGVIYEVSCPDVECNSKYIGETGRRFYERICDHVGKDKNSHVLKHSLASNHKPPDLEDFKVIGKGYKNSYKRKITEALLINKFKPTLNIQDKSIPLKLLN